MKAPTTKAVDRDNAQASAGSEASRAGFKNEAREVKEKAEADAKAEVEKASEKTGGNTRLRKEDEASQMFADLLKARMLTDERANLRNVESYPDNIIYEFTNGDKITVERKRVESAGSVDDVQKYISDVIANHRTRA